MRKIIEKFLRIVLVIVFVGCMYGLNDIEGADRTCTQQGGYSYPGSCVSCALCTYTFTPAICTDDPNVTTDCYVKKINIDLGVLECKDRCPNPNEVKCVPSTTESVTYCMSICVGSQPVDEC